MTGSSVGGVLASSAPPRIGNGSLTEQAAHALLQMILDRAFPGDRLPNEPDLAQQMGLSRTTVRAALQSLERLGVISRVPGRGTAIRPQVDRNCMLLHRLIGFKGLLESQYKKVTVEQTFEIMDSGSDLAIGALGAVAEGLVLFNDKRLFANGQPAVHLYQEIPVAYLEPGYADSLASGETPAPASIFELSHLYMPSREIDTTILDLKPGVMRKKKNTLDLAVGTPYLELRETHYNEANEPVAFSREIMRDELVHLRLVRTR